MEKPELEDAMMYTMYVVIGACALFFIGVGVWLIAQTPTDFWIAAIGYIVGFVVVAYAIHGARWLIWKIKEKDTL